VQEKYPSQSKVMLLSNFFLNAYNLKIRGQKKKEESFALAKKINFSLE
jgi:hypothetical protein